MEINRAIRAAILVYKNNACSGYLGRHFLQHLRPRAENGTSCPEWMMGAATVNDKPDPSPAAAGIFERLRRRAATIDELVSDLFEPVSGEAVDAGLAGRRRLDAWRRSGAAGDEELFARRLARDSLSPAKVQERFGAVRPNRSAAAPAWLDDAVWIEAVLQNAGKTGADAGTRATPLAFEQLLAPLIEQADARLGAGLDPRVLGRLTAAARADLRRALLTQLSELCAPAFYERFAKTRNDGERGVYRRFVVTMKAGGFRELFEDRPVLLRLVAVVMRQWIDTSREFALRLDADLPRLRREILQTGGDSPVVEIEGGVSDPHNGGHAVLIVTFADGTRVAYKPKDLRLDVAWHALIERLNRADPPLALKAARAIACDGYGWSEFIAHDGCASEEACTLFFRRAGALLALLHVATATDMHQENMIACGDHPVPVDLETILQPTAEEHKVQEPEGAAFDAAMEIVGNSVMTVGLLPAYGRSVDNQVFAMGGMTADWGERSVITWNGINSDAMRPARVKLAGETNTNLPHVAGRYAKFTDHVGDFVAGFAGYAEFLSRWSTEPDTLLGGFAGLPVRKVVRPTRFYYMLLQRLKNHRNMDDGAVWSAQADFVARLAEWDKDSDPLWPLHRAERDALLALNVPHFVSPSDGAEISDVTGIAVRTDATPGLDRARARLQSLDAREIAWQVEVIRANTNTALPATAPLEIASPPLAPSAVVEDAAKNAKETFIAEANRIAAEISGYAVRRGSGAAWIGLDWLGDSEVFQLVCLGPDLYNGAAGIAVFLAAHATVIGNGDSGELAVAALSHIRRSLKGRNAARVARALGTGGATGLGSVVYALAITAKCLNNSDLLADAEAAAKLITDEIIAADKQLDVIGGSAGAILALLRLYRDSNSADALDRAKKCGEHLLAQSRLGPEGHRSWLGQGSGARGPAQALNGMSHGAAGFAYALAALAAATGREDFAQAAAECVAFEDASYDAAHRNWPDLRGSEAHWPCQWCHGALGIGLSRLAIAKTGVLDAAPLAADIRNAVAGAEHNRFTPVDTLCCGTLGGVEFFCAAGGALGRGDLRERASRELMAAVERAAATGDYRWNNGKRQFNLGLFRGLSGVGYTLLRQIDASLPNVLVWE
jgi:type 2 lantibiotic biosynthesis protein LanM